MLEPIKLTQVKVVSHFEYHFCLVIIDYSIIRNMIFLSGSAMTKPVSIFSAAKRIGETSGWTLSQLQMQKILYIAHMYYMGMKDEPLVIGHFEAWDYGPVHPLLYHRLKIYGADPVPPEALFFAPSIDTTHPSIYYLDAAVTQLDLNKLVAITHWEQGAWARNYKAGSTGVRIPNKDIQEEYTTRQAG